MNFTMKERMALAAKGQALADGSFPIKNGQSLKDAIALVGKAKNPDAAKAHITKNAKAMGMSSALPPGWMKDSAGDTIAPGAKKDSAGDVLTPGDTKDSAGDTVPAAKAKAKGSLPPGLAAHQFKKKGSGP